jgi:signal transduction histidine kinase
LASLNDAGGWVEILNDRNEVVKVLGKAGEVIKAYPASELIRALENDPNQNYYYSMADFQLEGKPSYYLVKIPMENIDSNQLLNRGYRESEVRRYIATAFAAFVVLSAFIIWAYSLLTARKINTPLQHITEGIQTMIQGDYNIRLQYEAESELLQIRDAFNYMADKLQRIELEKIELENGKKKLLADIAHDLKTPLSTIHGFAKALQDDLVTDPDQRKQFLQSICQKTERINALMDSLFDFTVLDNPSFSLHLVQSDLCELLREITAEHYAEIDQKAFLLSVEIPEQSIFLAVDKEQLSRALSNLITNTVKYNPPGTRLRIQLIDDAAQVIMEVADNGIGIPEPLASSIFDPFVRGDDARASSGGAGLGLSITSKIIAHHGGKLVLDRNEQEITVFRILLPKF